MEFFVFSLCNNLNFYFPSNRIYYYLLQEFDNWVLSMQSENLSADIQDWCELLFVCVCMYTREIKGHNCQSYVLWQGFISVSNISVKNSKYKLLQRNVLTFQDRSACRLRLQWCLNKTFHAL